MDDFKAGEIAIFMDEINAPPRRWNGHDVLVLGPLENYILLGIRGPEGHVCRLPNGEEGFIALCFLRKKPPKQEPQSVGEWELCPWQPSQKVLTE